MKHKFSMRVGQVEIKQVERVTIKLDMFDVGNPFTFSTWVSNGNMSAFAAITRNVKLFDTCTLLIDDVPQFTGVIEVFNDSDKRTGATFVVSGRDVLGELVSWDADPKINLVNSTLSDVLKSVLYPFGIQFRIYSQAQAEQAASRKTTTVINTPADLEAIIVAKAKVKVGQKAFDFIQHVVKKHGLMVWSAPTGDGSVALIVDKPNYTQDALFKLYRKIDNAGVRTNFFNSEYRCNVRACPTVVTAYGYAPRGDFASSRFATDTTPHNLSDEEVRATAATGAMDASMLIPPSGDSNTPVRENRAIRLPFQNSKLQKYPFVRYPLRNHPIHLHSKLAKDPRTGEREAQRVISSAMRDFRTVSLDTLGCGQPDGSGLMNLFQLNKGVHFEDEMREMNEVMLIHSIEFNQDRKGSTTSHLQLGTWDSVQLSKDEE